ncbi:MAG: hypothetical protein WEB30_08595 [Cyclobacteriaceae bacterium]
MRINSIGSLAWGILVVALGCGMEGEELRPAQRVVSSSEVSSSGVSSPDLVGRDPFAWSEPVWLGPLINSTGREFGANLSSNGLSLYFNSDRGGSLDIWVSRRAGPGCPWQSPVNLGAPLNTALNEGVPNFTPDGRVAFFASHGHDSRGSADIFVSHRVDPNDDFGWEAPVNLGSDVNTLEHESSPAYVQSEGGGGQLYFTREGQFFTIELSRDGQTRGPAVHISELSEPGGVNRALTVRADGRELIFFSSAPHPGAMGLADLWVSNRRSVNDPWSAPRNLGPPVNSGRPELDARLSLDGQTLLICIGARPGGLGFQDLWMSTRGPSAKKEAVNSTQCPP